MRVLVSDKLSDSGIEILKKSGLEVAVKANLSPQELLKEIGGYEGLIVRSATKVTGSVIGAADRLKVIGRAGTGLDNIDLTASTKKGIVVMNSPGGNTVTTAEHTMAMLLSLARMIPQATASTKAGKWEKTKFTGVEIYNKTLGIVGMGQIGGYVAKLAQGFGMTIIASDPYLPQEKAAKMGVALVSLDDLYRRADFISVHVPLTDETRGMIGEKAFSQMRNGVRMINCARGGIMDERALLAALESGKVAGCALDVFEVEPVPPDHLLLRHENVICTPHIGAATTEAQESVAVTIAEQVADYLVKGIIRYAANFPSVPAEILAQVQAYLVLAEKLGSALVQVQGRSPDVLTIEYKGEVADLPVAPITMAVLKGLLSPVLESDTINYVNAPVIAQERGIHVREVRSKEAGDFMTLLVLSGRFGTQQAAVAGTLYRKKDPRIVEMEGFSLEVIPEGSLLVLANDDKPGVIGSIGSLLGSAGLNISRLHNGRERPGGKALTVVGIDTPAPPEILQEIRKLPHILTVKQIVL